MARIKLFGVEAEVRHLVWSCPDENVKAILEILNRGNQEYRRAPALPHVGQLRCFILDPAVGQGGQG
jgi:hypothetical protein